MDENREDMLEEQADSEYETGNQEETDTPAVQHMVIDQVGEKTDLNECPHCKAHPDCFAWMEGHCMALSKRAMPNGGQADCSFYKNREKNLAEAKKCFKRLSDSGRYDLIERHIKALTALGMLDDEIMASERYADELESYRKSNFQETLDQMLSDEDWDDEPDFDTDPGLDDEGLGEGEDEPWDETDENLGEDGGE